MAAPAQGSPSAQNSNTVVTTSPFLVSPHKVLESRGSSLQHLQILHHSACALVALADSPSHGFSSQRTLWRPGPALRPPLSWRKGPAQPPVGLRDPTPCPPSRQENSGQAHASPPHKHSPSAHTWSLVGRKPLPKAGSFWTRPVELKIVARVETTVGIAAKSCPHPRQSSTVES